MRPEHLIKNHILSAAGMCAAFLLFFSFAPELQGFYKTSANYLITWDVISCGGHDRESANYSVDSSVRQGGIGNVSGANYEIEAGFWAMGGGSSPTFTPTATATQPAGADWILATDTAFYPARYNHSMLEYDDGTGSALWVIGGAASGTQLNDVWSSKNGVGWTAATLNAAFTPRDGHASCVFNNKMWVIGGWDTTFTNDVWYSENGADWTLATGNAGFTPRMNSAAVVFNSRIYLIAGYSNSPTWKNDVWWSDNGVDWNLATDTAFATYGRGMHAAVVYDDGGGKKMWVIGGQGSSGELGEVYYSSDGITWNIATNAAPFGDRSYLTALNFRGAVFVMGGYDGTNIYNDVWASLDGVNWSLKTSTANWSPRMGQAGAVYDAGADYRMWITGGFVPSASDHHRDVWYSVSGMAATATVAATPVYTSSSTPTNTKTTTKTVTETITPTATPTITLTNTQTVTPTVTQTVTKTITPTVTQTATSTVTETTTPSATKTITGTVTETITYTVTDTVTKTATPSVTHTNTPSVTETITSTNSPTSTFTSTVTPTVTPTITQTNTSSVTKTITRTNTPAFTSTVTLSHTFSPTPTSSFTATGTSTNTPTFSETYTYTYTFTITNTPTPTMTHTITPTNSITPTWTASPTPGEEIALSKNYINVTNGEVVSVVIRRETAGQAAAEIKIYSLTGEIIRKWEETLSLDAGWNNIGAWDGANEEGRAVGRGIYFVFIKIDDTKEIRRIVVIK